MQRTTPTAQPTFETNEVNAIFERAKKLYGPARIVNGKFSAGAFRVEKRLESINTGRFIMRALGTTAPGRGAGRRLWHFEFIAEDFAEQAQDHKLFFGVPVEQVVGAR